MTRLAIVATHPIQYYSPWFRHLSQLVDLRVFYAHRQSAEGQAAAGFATPFDWDLPLLDGYDSEFLLNRAKQPGLSTFNGCDTPEMADTIARGRFDAVVTMGWNKRSYLQAALGARRAATPLFVRVDSQLRTQDGFGRQLLKRVIYSNLLPWAAQYLSPGCRSDAYLRHYGVPTRHIHRLAHMVDAERFAAGAMAAQRDGHALELRRQHGAAPGDFIFLFVGKLIPVKQPLLLLRAFQELVGVDAKVHLWFVGDGPLRQQVAEAASSMERVKLLGFINQSQLPASYAAGDCLVLPSLHETWGLVVNEAFACGIPAIVTDQAGCAPELIEENRTGWVAAPMNVGTLTEAMRIAVQKARSLPREAMKAKTAAGNYDTGACQLLAAISASPAIPNPDADGDAVSHPVATSKEARRA